MIVNTNYSSSLLKILIRVSPFTPHQLKTCRFHLQINPMMTIKDHNRFTNQRMELKQVL